MTAEAIAGASDRYDADYDRWGDRSARDYYRIFWRRRAAETGERTLISGIFPPGTSHVHLITSASTPRDLKKMVLAQGIMSTLLADCLVRVCPKDIYASVINRLPLTDENNPLNANLLLRTLRLNCLTRAYAKLWAECFEENFTDDAFVPGSHSFVALGEIGPTWCYETPLRLAADRRQALVEIDALVALMLGVSADQLCSVYRSQFAVLYGYDTGTSKQGGNYVFDTNGRVVPPQVLKVWREKREQISLEERTLTNASGNTYVYDLPFATYDREADMRAAYDYFEAML